MVHIDASLLKACCEARCDGMPHVADCICRQPLGYTQTLWASNHEAVVYGRDIPRYILFGVYIAIIILRNLLLRAH